MKFLELVSNLSERSIMFLNKYKITFFEEYEFRFRKYEIRLKEEDDKTKCR